MRFNLFGGAGVGKSTSAAWFFSHLKMENYKVELVSEYVKTWAYLNRPIGAFDQIYIFGKQLHYEERLLSNGVKNIITDCPVELSHLYGSYYKIPTGIAEPLRMLSNSYEKAYPSVDIFLLRGEREYKQEGRYQTKEEARKIDDYILDYLRRKSINKLEVIEYKDFDKLKEIGEKYADR